MKVIEKVVVKNRIKCDDKSMSRVVQYYLFQVLLRKGTSEHAITVNFNFSLEPHLPLGTAEKLASPEFPIPISFIYGDHDWTRVVDQDYAKVCVEANQFKEDSKFHLVPDSDHNMHMDNPEELSSLIIDDLLGSEESNSDLVSSSEREGAFLRSLS